MNKQNLWFLTLFSLVLVLGIYYVTMPNELLMGKEDTKVVVKKTKPKAEKTVKVTESSTLEAMRVSLTESRKEQINSLQSQLTDNKMTAEEKNNAAAVVTEDSSNEGEKKYKRVLCLLSDENYMHLKKQAGAMGITMKEYLNELVEKDRVENEHFYK